MRRGRESRFCSLQVAANEPCEDFVITEELEVGIFLLGIFDGHNGSECARFCVQNVCSVVRSELSHQESFVDVLKRSIGALDDLWTKKTLAAKGVDLYNLGRQGTTATLVLLRENTLGCAFVGDSKAMIGVRSGERCHVVPLVKNVHSTANLLEQERLTQLNSSKNLFVRVGDDTWYLKGQVQTTRAVGGFSLILLCSLLFSCSRSHLST
jgi:serine/threonine protein phosphatase PrpC